MKRRIALAALAALVPLAAEAAGNITNAVLSKVPAMPRDAASAYAQWNDTNGALTKGAVFSGTESAINATGQNIMLSMRNGGSMTMGAVSEHDQAALKRIAPYPQMGALRTRVSQAALDLAKLQAAYQADAAKIDAARIAETAKLAVCPGEAGVPSAGAAGAVALKYADQRVALATSYLGKEGAIVIGVRQAVAGETTWVDNVFVAWSALSDGMMKTAGHATVAGMQATALGDVAVVLGYVEDASKVAARAVADKNKLARDAAQAKGC